MRGGRRPGAGRPESEDPRTEMIRVRVTPAERAYLLGRADAQGLGVSEYLRVAGGLEPSERRASPEPERREEPRTRSPRGQCPWYITAAAVRAYASLEGFEPDEEGGFARAEDELMAIAEELAQKTPTRQRNGLLRYRGPKRKRYTYLVSDEERPEGPLPQLVDVRPEHA